MKSTGISARTSVVIHSEALIERFTAIDAFLIRHQSFWRAKPFCELQLAWEQQHPELAQFLRNRSLDQAEQAWQADDLQYAPTPLSHLYNQANQLSTLDFFTQRTLSKRPERLMRDVPGRKWQQIQAFAQVLEDADYWLDWCAGKGHLGRFLAHPDKQLICLEQNPQLVQAGVELSQRAQINAQHIVCDVLSEQAATYLTEQQTAVALHACGDLHTTLINKAIAHKVQAVAIAPCCYNRTQQHYYQALSSAGKQSQLTLTKDDLALPLQSTVTAGKREIKQRNQSMAWRLAFDLLQRETRQSSDYLPTPSLSSQWWKKSFATWCQDLAVLKGFTINNPVDWNNLEQQGWQRLAEVRNLELMQKIFQRPLELWLVLDKALHLQENGYKVELAQFCSDNLTPRNLLIKARLKKS